MCETCSWKHIREHSVLALKPGVTMSRELFSIVAFGSRYRLRTKSDQTGFEAKPGETVAAGFEAETSKPRCRCVSPRPVILTAGKSLPVPLHSGHLVTCTGFPFALTWSSRCLHQPNSFKAKPSETSASLAFSMCQHGSPLTSPSLPIVQTSSPEEPSGDVPWFNLSDE